MYLAAYLYVDGWYLVQSLQIVSCCGDKSGVTLRGTNVATAVQGFSTGNMGSRSRRGAEEGVTG